MIITVGTSKGGAGKSTLCTNLVVQHLPANPDTAMVDADPQKSSSCWSAVRESKERTPGVLTFEKSGNDFGRQILRMNEKYPSIFIDVAGRNSPEFRASLLISDLLVLPLRPSTFDAWSFAADMELVAFARLQNERLKVLVVYNAVSTNPQANRAEIADMDAYMNDYADNNLIISRSKVMSRSGFVKAVGEGASVTELFGKQTSESTEKAKLEIIGLYNEVIETFNEELP